MDKNKLLSVLLHMTASLAKITECVWTNTELQKKSGSIQGNLPGQNTTLESEMTAGEKNLFDLPQRNTDNSHEVHASHFEHTKVTVNSTHNADIL